MIKRAHSSFSDAALFVLLAAAAAVLVLLPMSAVLEEQMQFTGDCAAAKRGEIELIYCVNGVIDEALSSGQYEAWFDEYAQESAGQD